MLKVGDRVAPYYHMSNVGTIVELHTRKTSTWMAGGSPSSTIVVIVEHDSSGERLEYKTTDLRKED
tara:strand:+ start:830 stop:1027 length:198 start_codon:yes stop_codon:yes gene_type:complete